jgi:hypothetical protein
MQGGNQQVKNIYDILNDAKVRAEGYEPMELNDLEKAGMKQSIRRAANAKKKFAARWAAVAACMVCVIGFSQTAYAKEALNNILKSISVGHNTVIQVDPAKEKREQYYDKDGKPITEINGKTDLYDAKGNKVATINNDKNDADDSSKYAIEGDLNKTTPQLTFKLQTPKNIPAGYSFDHSRLYKGESGKINGDYVDLFYKNGDSKIFIQERRITNDTTFTFATDGTVEEVTVNGHKAAIADGCSITWEQNGVSVDIVAKSLSKDELLAFAESFQ